MKLVASVLILNASHVYAELDLNSRKILVLGDSLSAAYRIDEESGWVALLARRLAENGGSWTVQNQSVSGATTLDGLNRIDYILETEQPDILILELGANDGLRGYLVASIQENLTKIIEQAQTSGARVLLAGMQLPQNYGPKYLDEFKSMFITLAEKHDTRLIPFFMDGVAAVDELMQEDGIHPNAEGQPGLLENVWQALEPMLLDKDSQSESQTMH